jgi:hypothetical protein
MYVYLLCLNVDIFDLFSIFQQCQEVTVFKLKDEIDEAANRLMFLLDYATMPCKSQGFLNIR